MVVSTETKRVQPKKDPPIRKDGLCAKCGQPRPLLKGRPVDDPFCSSTCCRAYWGTEL